MPLDMNQVYKEQRDDLYKEIEDMKDYDPRKRKALEKIRRLNIDIQYSERFKQNGGKY